MFCFAYKAYDRFKRSWLASKVFFGGDKFQHFEEIYLEGVVADRDQHTTDGDNTFDLNVDGMNWHCEVTPCSPCEVLKAARALKPGTKVKVTGNRTWDPTHLGTPGHWEIHPVKGIQVLL